MSEEEQQEPPRMQDKEISYKDFSEFLTKFPESTNEDLYEAFPNKPKGTIRGWKAKLKNSESLPPPEDATQHDFVIKGLCNDLGVDYSTLKAMGLSYNASLNYLQQKSIDRELEQTKKKTSKAGGILPAPIGYDDTKDLGIVEYITKFDGINQKMEIEIPFDVLYDADKVKGLGEMKSLSREAVKRRSKFRFA
jgi:hypothetical protein